jgi:hypothetical protein
MDYTTNKSEWKYCHHMKNTGEKPSLSANSYFFTKRVTCDPAPMTAGAAVMDDRGREARHRRIRHCKMATASGRRGGGASGCYLARMRVARQRTRGGSCTGDSRHGCDG